MAPANTIDGYGGNDTLSGDEGDDSLAGGLGTHLADGGSNSAAVDVCDAETEVECER